MAEYENMSIDELGELIEKLSGIQKGKIEARKQELRDELAKLEGKRVRRKASGDKRGSPAPKYRSKRNPDKTWAGRGATPTWMSDEIEQGLGKSKEDFEI